MTRNRNEIAPVNAYLIMYVLCSRRTRGDCNCRGYNKETDAFTISFCAENKQLHIGLPNPHSYLTPLINSKSASPLLTFKFELQQIYPQFINIFLLWIDLKDVFSSMCVWFI